MNFSSNNKYLEKYSIRREHFINRLTVQTPTTKKTNKRISLFDTSHLGLTSISSPLDYSYFSANGMSISPILAIKFECLWIMAIHKRHLTNDLGDLGVGNYHLVGGGENFATPPFDAEMCGWIFP